MSVEKTVHGPTIHGFIGRGDWMLEDALARSSPTEVISQDPEPIVSTAWLMNDRTLGVR